VVLVFFAAAVAGDQRDPRDSVSQLTYEGRTVNVGIAPSTVR
jgi:hypothetical protein